MSSEQKTTSPRGPSGKSTRVQPPKKPTSRPTRPWWQRICIALGFTAWVIAAFFGAQLLLGGAIYALDQVAGGIVATMNESVLQAVLAALVYALSLVVAVGVPWVLFKSQRLTRSDLGFAEVLPSWRDIGLAPIVFVVTLIVGMVALYLAGLIVPGVDLQTEQQVGFDSVTQRYELLMAFVTLVVMAPVFEEILFRGYLYGRIRRHVSAAWTVILTSLAFGAMHLYAGADHPLQWNVMITTTVLALGMGLLRAYTGNVWSAILVHMLKNGIAFFALFILPILGITLL